MSEVIDASDKQICAASTVALVDKRCRVAKPQRLLVEPVHFISCNAVGSNHHTSGVVGKGTIVGVALCRAYLIKC